MEKYISAQEGGENLFSESSHAAKLIERVNPMVHPLSNPDDYKRQRDEDAENFRKKQRAQIFKSKRMYEEELPELEIPDVGPKTPEHIMEEAGKPAITEPPVSIADLPMIMQEFWNTAPEICLAGLNKLRRLLSAKGPTPIQEIMDLGFLPRLLELLKCKEKPLIQVNIREG